jgi:hypothetical protein
MPMQYWRADAKKIRKTSSRQSPFYNPQSLALKSTVQDFSISFEET